MRLNAYLTNHNAYDIFSATNIKIKAFLYDDVDVIKNKLSEYGYID